MTRNQYLGRLAVGIVAMALWLILFCGGLLIETVEYRAYLAPHSFPKHHETDKEAGVDVELYSGSPMKAFIYAAIWFTPTNLALLALLGGLMGGCGSNILVERMPTQTIMQLEDERMRFLVESPWSAMMRSFIVYLCIIAGLYVVIDDPFKNSSPAQYVRLAGTVSVVALLVGYDPSRIRDWIDLVRVPISQRITVTKGDLTLEAKQGPIATVQDNQIVPHSDGESIVVNGSQDGKSNSERASPGRPR